MASNAAANAGEVGIASSSGSPSVPVPFSSSSTDDADRPPATVDPQGNTVSIGRDPAGEPNDRVRVSRGGPEGARGGGGSKSGRATAVGATSEGALAGNAAAETGASPEGVSSAGGVDGADASITSNADAVAVLPTTVDGSGAGRTRTLGDTAGAEPSEQAPGGKETVREGQEHPDEGERGEGGEKEGGHETRQASSSQQKVGETPSIPRAGLLRLLRKEGPLRRNLLASEALRPILTDRDFTKVGVTDG